MSEIPFRPQRTPLVPIDGIECHVADMTVTIGAELPLATVQAKLAEHGQWLPIDGDETLPVGRLVEENSSGPLRLGFGAWRDLLLGCQFLSGAGDLITAGGRTIKNVAGYDLTKFMIGQRGIFGKLVTITTRTYRRPAGALVAKFPPSDQFVSQIIATPLRPRWAALRDDALYFGWIDDDPALEFFAKLAGEYGAADVFRRSVASDIAHRHELWPARGDYFRASIPPSRILSFAEQALAPAWSADAAFGIVVGPLDGADVERIHAAARNVGGSATILNEGLSPRWNPNSGERAILSELKKAFDPENRLARL